MTSTRRYLAIGIPLLLIVALALYRILSANTSGEQRRQNLPLVKLEAPTRATVTATLQFSGDVVALQQASIYAKVGGNLERIFVDIGTPVRSGQVLALIDTTELHQQYQQAQATYENARVNFRRSRELSDQNLVARQDLDNAETAFKIASAAFEGAKTRLSYARITAPFSGFITRRFLDRGALVTQNTTTLFMLMDLDNMKVVINVLEKDIPVVTPGKEAMIRVDAYPGRKFPGKVTRLSRAVDPGTRTMAVEINIPNNDHALTPGMFANVDLIIDTHPNALTIPSNAILRDDEGYYIYTVQNDTARRVRVTTGSEEASRLEIRSGLDSIPLVITTGQQFVRNGGPVLVQK
jgi:membrane fusion protein (multidrug efflux system)